LLDREARIDLAGAAADVSRTITDCSRLRPDVVLLDGAGEDGVEAIEALVAAIPEVRVVALGVSESERDIIACAEAGVAGLVSRDASLPDLVATIERVEAGETLCSPRIAAILLRRLAALAAQRNDDPAAQLTVREQEILGLIDEGLSNKQIARRLYIELPTVKNHVHNILEKLHVHRRYEAAARMRAGRMGA
jgi:two-component system, NarL family, nitrate/nitrite response regulator NarL